MNLTEAAKKLFNSMPPINSSSGYDADRFERIESVLKELVEEAETRGAVSCAQSCVARKEATIETYRICAEIAEQHMPDCDGYGCDYIQKTIRDKAAEDWK